MADPYNFDPESELGIYRNAGGKRIIPTTTVRRRGGGGGAYTNPGIGPDPYMQAMLPAVRGGGVASAPAGPPPMMPATAGMPANRFGSSNAFMDSLARGRALRASRAGTFAQLKSEGEKDKQAAQSAYAGQQALGADLQLQQAGYGPDVTQNRFLAMEQNNRANQALDINGQIVPFMQGMDLQRQQAAIDKANADAAASAARTSTLIPAQVMAQQANAAFAQARTNNLLPAQVAAQQAAAAKTQYETQNVLPGQVARQQFEMQNVLPGQVAHTAADTAQMQMRTQLMPYTAQAQAQRGQFDPVPPPQLGAPPAPAGSKPLTADIAQQYMDRAGGNRDVARQMARQDGYTF